MPSATLQEAQANLVEIVHQLAPGEGVTIGENDQPIARLVIPPVAPARPPCLRPPITGVPKPGQYEGRLVIPDNFGEPLEELRGYMG